MSLLEQLNKVNMAKLDADIRPEVEDMKERLKNPAAEKYEQDNFKELMSLIEAVSPDALKEDAQEPETKAEEKPKAEKKPRTPRAKKEAPVKRGRPKKDKPVKRTRKPKAEEPAEEPKKETDEKPQEVIDCEKIISDWKRSRESQKRSAAKTAQKSTFEKITDKVELAVEQAIKDIPAKEVKESPAKYLEKFERLKDAMAEFLMVFRTVLGGEYEGDETNQAIKAIEELIEKMRKRFIEKKEDGGIVDDTAEATGEKFAKGGYVGKGEMVWRKISNSKKAEFLYENFTPEITPRSQEILIGKSWNFLPKKVKIKFEAKYADVEEYAKGGELDVSVETPGTIEPAGKTETGVIKGEISGIPDMQPLEENVYAKGGRIEEIAEAIFYSNNGKNDMIETTFGRKTETGLRLMIENTEYSAKDIAEAIFYSNSKRGKIKTGYGDKSLAGLTDMIESARLDIYAKGGKVGGSSFGSAGTILPWLGI